MEQIKGLFSQAALCESLAIDFPALGWTLLFYWPLLAWRRQLCLPSSPCLCLSSSVCLAAVKSLPSSVCLHLYVWLPSNLCLHLSVFICMSGCRQIFAIICLSSSVGLSAVKSVLVCLHLYVWLRSNLCLHLSDLIQYVCLPSDLKSSSVCLHL